MKTTLHKPQREIMNTVLAYQDEEMDELSYTYTDDWYCNYDTVTCDFEANVGDCTETIWINSSSMIETCY